MTIFCSVEKIEFIQQFICYINQRTVCLAGGFTFDDKEEAQFYEKLRDG